MIARGSSGQPIFIDGADRMLLLRQLARIREPLGWECISWCLMATHLHLVVRTPKPNLGAGMQRLLGAYAFRFNRRHGRFGHLFAGPYYARAVKADGHLIRASLYVVLNPVAAGLCAHPRQWHWCSYGSTAEEVTDTVTQPEFLLSVIDQDLPRARERYQDIVDQEVRELRAGKRLVPD